MITSPIVIRVATAMLRVVPLGMMRGVAKVAGAVAYLVQGDRRRTVLDTLTRTAPNETPARRRLLARRTFRNLASASIDLYRLPSVHPQDVTAMIEVRGSEHIDAARAMGKGVLIVTGHVGPYELGGAWMAALGFPVHAMVEDLAPDVLDALGSYRRATGMGLISMKQGLRAVYRLLQEQQMVLLVADRAIGEGAERGAVDVPFCGGVRSIPTGPATFAMATGAPIVVGFIALNPARTPRYLVEFDPPLVPSGRGDDERLRLTRSIADRLATAVRDHPDEWYVFQPQWIPIDRDQSAAEHGEHGERARQRTS